MRKPDSCLFVDADTAQLINVCVFVTWIVKLVFFLNPKFQDSIAISCSCTSRFVSDRVGNPEDRFSHVAHMGSGGSVPA